MTAAAWWQVLYEQRYRRGWREPARITERQVAFLIGALHLTAADQVLDVACGYGRHALSLLEQGYRVVGLDYGQRLIEEARSEAERRGLAGARFVWGNMLQPGLGAFPGGTRFDAAYLMDVSFGFFSDAENRQVLGHVAGVLRPGGRLLLDLFNPWTVQRLVRQSWSPVGEGRQFLLSHNRLDPRAHVMYFESRFVDLDRQLVEDFPAQRIRVYSYPEVEHMLAAAGCRVAAVYGESMGWPAQPYDENAFGLVLVAEKER